MKHPTKDIDRKVGVVGCKHTTRDLIENLSRRGFQIDHCITISEEKAISQEVAGYFDLRPYLDERGIPCTVVHEYSLKNDEDRETLLALGLDAVFVMGWQRIIPAWFLESLSIGAFGMHGSFKPLPHGRGRSPMNWSMILNKTEFFTHLFQYLPGVDDGPVVGQQVFDITPHDTCLTTHHKNLLAMVQLISRHLPDLLDGSIRMSPQPEEGASYFPKRSPEDGLIYWSETTTDIYNLIRAVTHPFPGAFTFLDDVPKNKVFIWWAIPFDTHLRWPEARPGEILQVFYDGTFLVRTGDFSLLVQDYEGLQITEVDIGRRFGHLDTPRKVWDDLPR